MAYSCFYLTKELNSLPEQKIIRPVENTVTPAGTFTFSNGLVQITVKQENAWAITDIIDVATNTPLQPADTIMNQLSVYYEREVVSGLASGNLYQMGNELFPQSTNGDGFYSDASGVFKGGVGKMNEEGPYRWRFTGHVYNAANKLQATIEYFLEYNEPLVRIQVTGNASNDASAANTIVTKWGLKDNSGNSPVGMQYGTANHWTKFDTVPYWYGPTFCSTHDYITLSSSDSDDMRIAAMYHEGMRAWALEDGQLMGILFRNAPGTARGAYGTDTAVHTQRYAFRIDGVNNPSSCQPLMESMAFQQPLLVAAAPNTDNFTNPMPATGYLAALTSPNALIRFARTQKNNGGGAVDSASPNFPSPFSFVMRIYQPTNDTSISYEVRVPSLSDGAKVSMVTALEENIDQQNEPLISNQTTITLPAMPTLATIRIEDVGLAS